MRRRGKRQTYRKGLAPGVHGGDRGETDLNVSAASGDPKARFRQRIAFDEHVTRRTGLGQGRARTAGSMSGFARALRSGKLGSSGRSALLQGGHPQATLAFGVGPRSSGYEDWMRALNVICLGCILV